MVRRTHNYADGGKIVKDHLAAGAPLGATPVNTDTTGRPRVGEADPATRRKLLNQRLKETQPASSKPAPERASISKRTRIRTSNATAVTLN